MAVDVSELETLRDALPRARANGTRRVSYADGRAVDYASDADMAGALADLEARIRQASPRRPSTVRFSATKGM